MTRDGGLRERDVATVDTDRSEAVLDGFEAEIVDGGRGGERVQESVVNVGG